MSRSGRSTSRPESLGAPVYLHIGAMKTGTTYLQRLMEAHRGPLAKGGHRVAGRSWDDQYRAVRDLLAGLRGDQPQPGDSGMWERVTAGMVAERERSSVMSMEFLSFLDREGAKHVLNRLGARDVQVVLTVRDATHALRAQWATKCQEGGTMTWRRFVRGVADALDGQPQGRRPQGRSARVFRRTQDVRRMLDVWVPLLGADHVHVITVPPPGSDRLELWRRFAWTIGADPDVVTTGAVADNQSLGYASTELLRRVNLDLRVGKPPPEYRRAITLGVVHPLRGQDEPSIPLFPRAAKIAARSNAVMRSAISDSGVAVIGSLEDLPLEPAATEAGGPPAGEHLLAAAAVAYDGLVVLQRPDGPHDPAPATAWAAAPDPVAAAVADVARELRGAMSQQV